MTSKQERKTRTGNKMGVVKFSDTSGQYEAVLFSEGLAQYRDMLEPGKSVVITVSAEDRPEGVNMRIQTVQSLENVASQVQKSLRIYLRDPGRLARWPASLASRGEGQVSFIVIKDGRAGEVRDRAARPLSHLAAGGFGHAGGARRRRGGTGLGRAGNPRERESVCGLPSRSCGAGGAFTVTTPADGRRTTDRHRLAARHAAAALSRAHASGGPLSDGGDRHRPRHHRLLHRDASACRDADFPLDRLFSGGAGRGRHDRRLLASTEAC